MYQPRKNKLFFLCYAWYINFILKRHFKVFGYDELTVHEDQSILLLANRFSWWDGFMLFHLNKKVFKKEFHALVATADYEQLSCLKYFGAFAPEQQGKDVLKTLNYAGSLLDDPKNLVLIFPQGQIKSGHVRKVAFEKGVMQVVNASQKKFQTVFSVILVDYFDSKKPQAHAYLTAWEATEYISLQLLKSEYNKHYDHAISKQSQKAP